MCIYVHGSHKPQEKRQPLRNHVSLLVLDTSSRLLREGAPAAVLRNVSHACFEDGMVRMNNRFEVSALSVCLLFRIVRVGFSPDEVGWLK